MTRKNKKGCSKSLLIALLVLAIAGACGTVYYYSTFYRNNIVGKDEPTEVKIYRSYDYDQALKTLLGSGIIANENSFMRAAKNMHLDRNLKPGRYVFKKGMGNKQIVRTLALGWQKPVNLVVRGYYRNLDDFANFLGEKLEPNASDFREAFEKEAASGQYGFNMANLIGMFIPNTYEVWWTVTPDEFLEKMHNEYEKFWTGTRISKAADAKLTRQEVSTLASIVIEETKNEAEMPTVAGVYINRLEKGMLLQADPTVVFAVGKPGLKRVLKKHLAVDSPYNTYKYAGLPPGPITMPPISAIDAVLNYKHHDYLYFCASPKFDGTHNFAKTLAEHNANAKAYQKAL